MIRGGLTITCNAEFYNYRELRERLRALGHAFKTGSDTEVFLAAWEEWGPQALQECNGFWALGMWDEARQHLILARDRFGKQPLYYVQQGDRIVFASEMKALFPFLREVRPAHNFRELAADLRGYEATERCLIEGVKRFPAGHWGEFAGGKLKLHRYWNTLDHLQDVPQDYRAQVNRFRELWDDACRLRLRSDVPVGAALSGGLDSAAVVSSVSGMQADIRAFTISFPGTIYDETAAARRVAENSKVELEILSDSAPDPAELKRQLYMFEELHDNCLSPKVALYRGMRDGGRVVSVDGHGADELLSGYGEGLFYAFGDAGWSMRNWRNILTAYNHFYPEAEAFAKPRADWKTALAYRLQGGSELPKELRSQLGHQGAYLYELFHRSIFPVMLRNYDRYAMMSGVEVRMPFTDHRLVSYLFSLPWDSKLRNGYTKAILRDAMQGRVPDEVRLKRAKLGFPTPVIDWIKGPWREFLMDMAESRIFRESSLGDGKQTATALREIIEGPEPSYFSGLQIWGKLAPFLWEWAVFGE